MNSDVEPIQLFVPTFQIEETLKEIRECLEKGWTGLGFKTVQFEKAWCDYTGLSNAHFLNSATAGLHLAIRVLKLEDGWQDGDEIITTPLTFVSTNHAIFYENLQPVFADVDEYLCLSPESVLERISPRTRAVMFVGIGGNYGRLPEIAAICEERGLRLILDAAHMTGTRWNGRHVGHEADVTVFSFQAVKNLPTADSGMICFRQEHLDQLVRKMTWLGINKDTYSRTHSKGAYKWMYEVDHVGFKYHGNSIMAAMGLVALKQVDLDNAYRRQISQWYEKEFSTEDKIKTIPVPVGCESSRHLYQVMVSDRDEVILALNALQIYPGVHYRDNTCYQMYSYAQGTCLNASLASDMLLSLPIHMKLSYGDVQRVSKALIEIVNRNRVDA
ncbi:MAG: DegT/DnrJ/EryC1/StrS family aminotransferase [Ardenticatenaceae bacterium]|nr:DegT/DnrJ/EryC1/StrS family aminotransferase [Ardenticatenaceae bacterium]